MPIQIDGQVIIIIILLIFGISLYIYNNMYSESKEVSDKAEKDYVLKRMAELKNPNQTIHIHGAGVGGKDQITKDDEDQINDPLKYPYTRLPRYIIDQYKDSGFYESGAFGSASNYFDDTEKIIGNLISSDPLMPAFPIFEKPSATNRDRYFYYTIDTRLSNNMKIKVPMNTIVLNGRQRNNVVDNGIEQIMDEDTLEILDYNFPDQTVFTARLYPRQSGLYYNPYMGGNPVVTSKYSQF